jgi:hypothetical protein
MLRLKENCPPRETEDRQAKRQQVELCGLLDRCTQILRNDRLVLRQRIKEGDPELVTLFRRHRKDRDLSKLQAQLRRVLAYRKHQAKYDHLSRIKESLLEHSLSRAVLLQRPTV